MELFKVVMVFMEDFRSFIPSFWPKYRSYRYHSFPSSLLVLLLGHKNAVSWLLLVLTLKKASYFGSALSSSTSLTWTGFAHLIICHVSGTWMRHKSFVLKPTWERLSSKETKMWCPFSATTRQISRYSRICSKAHFLKTTLKWSCIVRLRLSTTLTRSLKSSLSRWRMGGQVILPFESISMLTIVFQESCSHFRVSLTAWSLTTWSTIPAQIVTQRR